MPTSGAQPWGRALSRPYDERSPVMESRFIAGKGYARAARTTVALADCREGRMQRVAAGLALLGLVALMPPSVRADATSSPGKNAAAASAINLSVTNVSPPIAV